LAVNYLEILKILYWAIFLLNGERFFCVLLSWQKTRLVFEKLRHTCSSHTAVINLTNIFYQLDTKKSGNNSLCPGSVTSNECTGIKNIIYLMGVLA